MLLERNPLLTICRFVSAKVSIKSHENVSLFFFLGVGVRDYGGRESETTNEELHPTIPSKLLQVKRPFTKEYLALILNQQRSH